MNTDIHVKSDPLPINPVEQYTQFKVGACFFSGENFIAHSFCGGCGKCSFEFFFQICILERFGVYFNIILSKKCSLLTYEIMIVQPGG